MKIIRKTTNHITTINTEKFKTTTIKVSFKTDLTRENVTPRIMLANVLRNSSKTFASKKILSAHLEELYGANLSVSAKKQGSIHAISFFMQVANEKFLKSAPPLFEEALVTLSEIIINPKIVVDAFDKEVVNLEARLLKEEIESIIDDKTTYALKKLIAQMCETESFGISGDGYIEDLVKINEKTLIETYQSMIQDDEVNIVVLGDVLHEEVVAMFNQNLNLTPCMRNDLSKVENQLSPIENQLSPIENQLSPIENQLSPIENQLSPIDWEEKEISEIVKLQEEQLVNQAKLNIGYRTFTRMTDEDYFSLLVLNGILGAFAHSKLFVNVREKESLCYYCASQLDNFKGLLYIYSGLDSAQIPKAITIIDKQIADICTGNITSQELSLAKKSIINAKRESLDSSAGMLSDLEMGAILKMSAEEFVAKIETITKEDIVEVAKKIKKDTVFTLIPKEAEHHLETLHSEVEI